MMLYFSLWKYSHVITQQCAIEVIKSDLTELDPQYNIINIQEEPDVHIFS